MAKKGQPLQLQTEVNNDEEWEKLLQRDGLIVVDIYSEWCGPCSGMAATLKKIKLEIGGDLLQLAIAKADKIADLQRFRNKSEPTWMFIANAKMVNFMFGANAPKLTKMITEELKKEQEAREGRRQRVELEISEPTDEEIQRLAVVEGKVRAAREKERAKAAKELYERRMAEAEKILDTLQHFGIVLVFPHARTMYNEAIGDHLFEVGLTISQVEKVNLTKKELEELFYFAGEIPFEEEALETLVGEEQSVILLVKPIPARDVQEKTDELLLQIIYGDMMKPPGRPNSPAVALGKIHQEPLEDGTEQPPLELTGIWVPEDEKIKATALRLFFPKLTEHYLIPEPEPIPPHYAVIFEANRRGEVQELLEKYEGQVLRYGFFSSEVPDDAKLIAKSIKKYDRTTTRNPEEKLVIQLSKKQSECVLAFAQLKPFYISANAAEGEDQCRVFFPEDYDEPPGEEEEEEEEVPKKGRKKRVSGAEGEEEAAPAEGEEEMSTAETELTETEEERTDEAVTDSEAATTTEEGAPEGAPEGVPEIPQDGAPEVATEIPPEAPAPEAPAPEAPAPEAPAESVPEPPEESPPPTDTEPTVETSTEVTETITEVTTTEEEGSTVPEVTTDEESPASP